MTIKRRDRYHRANNNTYFSCFYHLVWTPKYRRKVLVDGIDERLKIIIQEVCQEKQAVIEALEVMPDHVHLLVDIDPQFGINQLVRIMKGRSSRFLRREFPRLARMKSLWTNSVYISTVGRVTIKTVKQYIERQKEVHAGKDV